MEYERNITPEPDYSCLQEGARSPNTLPVVFEFLRPNLYSSEIITVNNTSMDNTSPDRLGPLPGGPTRAWIDG